MIEVYKIISGYAQPIIDNFFHIQRKKHNLRNFQIMLKKIQKNMKMWPGENILQNISPLRKSPRRMQLANSLSEFKSKIKGLKSDAWVCHLC